MKIDRRQLLVAVAIGIGVGTGLIAIVYGVVGYVPTRVSVDFDQGESEARPGDDETAPATAADDGAEPTLGPSNTKTITIQWKHDVPFEWWGGFIGKNSWFPGIHSRISATRPLTLADLNSPAVIPGNQRETGILLRPDQFEKNDDLRVTIFKVFPRNGEIPYSNGNPTDWETRTVYTRVFPADEVLTSHSDPVIHIDMSHMYGSRAIEAHVVTADLNPIEGRVVILYFRPRVEEVPHIHDLQVLYQKTNESGIARFEGVSEQDGIIYPSGDVGQSVGNRGLVASGVRPITFTFRQRQDRDGFDPW